MLEMFDRRTHGSSYPQHCPTSVSHYTGDIYKHILNQWPAILYNCTAIPGLVQHGRHSEVMADRREEINDIH